MQQGIGPLTPDKFTEQAQQVLTTSQEYLREFGHNQWDVEHLALALLEQENGLPQRILHELGVDGAAARAALRRSLDTLPKMAYQGAQMYATPRVLRVLDGARQEAERFRDEFIST